MLRFVLIFVSLSLAFNVFLYGYFARSAPFAALLDLYASVSAAVMRLFGSDVFADGATVWGPTFAITVAVSCDALQPTSLFCFAVIATPAPLSAKLIGVLLGVPLLLTLNIARVTSLYYVGVHLPSWFDIIHLDVWQAAFILIAMSLWIVWALWAMRRSRRVPGDGR